MAVLYGTQMTKLRNTVPQDLPAARDVGGKIRCFNETITLAAQATTDTIEVAKLPKGATPLFGIISSTVSLGTSTVAIGITGTTGKYRTAAVFTATDTPTFFGNVAVMGVQLAAEEIVIITIATAALPGSGTLRVMFFYAVE